MFWDTTEIRKIQGFWHRSNLIGATNAFRANFQPSRDDVIILASSQKTGTTWLKALSHCILFRDDEEEDMLTKVNPHSCAPSFEIRVYAEDPSFRLTDQRRLFHTHLPYSHLPSSIKSHARNCKLIYIARDPKDTLISQWHFFNKILTKESDPPFPLDRAVESFCTGAIPFGPYWDHMLEYYEQSKTSPEHVMFVKYEDLHRDTKLHVRQLAKFMGRPFGDGDDVGGEEEDDVEVEKVIWRSSFDRLKGLDANKTGMTSDLYFRRGEVGDWRNHLTPEMAKRIDDITRVKFRGCGLYLKDEGDVDSKPMI
ncbi:Cytosolic sulfotransferase 1 [Linum perenne]